MDNRWVHRLCVGLCGVCGRLLYQRIFSAFFFLMLILDFVVSMHLVLIFHQSCSSCTFFHSFSLCGWYLCVKDVVWHRDLNWSPAGDLFSRIQICFHGLCQRAAFLAAIFKKKFIQIWHTNCEPGGKWILCLCVLGCSVKKEKDRGR